ncbi:peptide methionine sulfoxide reductase [Orobanche hederae]
MKLTAAVFLVTIILWAANSALSIRFPDRISQNPDGAADQILRTAAFALGSFWRSEAVFGCLDGVVRTAVGYAGGSKPSPEYRSLGDDAECVQLSCTKYLKGQARRVKHTSPPKTKGERCVEIVRLGALFACASGA